MLRDFWSSLASYFFLANHPNCFRLTRIRFDHVYSSVFSLGETYARGSNCWSRCADIKLEYIRYRKSQILRLSHVDVELVGSVVLCWLFGKSPQWRTVYYESVSTFFEFTEAIKVIFLTHPTCGCCWTPLHFTRSLLYRLSHTPDFCVIFFFFDFIPHTPFYYPIIINKNFIRILRVYYHLFPSFPRRVIIGKIKITVRRIFAIIACDTQYHRRRHHRSIVSLFLSRPVEDYLVKRKWNRY